jgi:hypothetical protein
VTKSLIAWFSKHNWPQAKHPLHVSDVLSPFQMDIRFSLFILCIITHASCFAILTPVKILFGFQASASTASASLFTNLHCNPISNYISSVHSSFFATPTITPFRTALDLTANELVELVFVFKAYICLIESRVNRSWRCV